jgi:hypothetical protein
MKLLLKIWRVIIPQRDLLTKLLITSLLGAWLVSCATPSDIKSPNPEQALFLPTSKSSPRPAEPTPSSPIGLPENQIATLSSLQKIDNFPLYTMHYSGSYSQFELPSGANNREPWRVYEDSSETSTDWACSLFAAFADTKNMYFGRNFDWEFSPALLLFTDPPDGYASVSMVDIAYLGFSDEQVRSLTDLPLIDLKPLLRAPNWPFDGMNEHGVAIGMAAVPPGDMRPDPKKETIGSLQIMRQILDKAANVDQAITILDSFNIDFGAGPALHYLIADSSGEAFLVEFYAGQIHLIPTENPWHQATNFLFSSVDDPQGQCRRYDTISNELLREGGRLIPNSALELLSSVSQINTQWSILYHMVSGKIEVVMGKRFNQPYQLQLIP